MAGVRAWFTRLASLVKTGYGDRALDEELRFHTELLIEKLEADGWPRDQAIREAGRQLGSLSHTRETYREQRGLPTIEHFVTDVRHSIRGLVRSPAFTFVTILTLGLAVSATTLVFSVVYGVLLRPLPYPNANRLVEIVQLLPSSTGEVGRAGIENDQLRVWRDSSRTLAQLGFYGGGTPMTFMAGTEAVRLSGGAVSPVLFDALGVTPLLGRAFRADEELPGHERVVMLSARTWTRYYGANPGLVGHTVTVNAVPYRVVGIMPPAFAFPAVTATSIGRDSSGRVDTAPEFWLPPELAAVRKEPAQGFTLRPAMARLREGVSLEQATAEANILMPPLPNGQRRTVELVPFQAEMARNVRSPLLLFQVGVTFVLLIAAINVANLMLARATHRHRELAIRIALGAGSLQIARRVFAEALVLAFGGGLLGWALTLAAYPVLKSLPPKIIPRLADIRIDTPVLFFTSALSLVLGLSIGLFVTVRVLRAKPWRWLKEIAGSTAGATAFGPNRPSNVLVIIEIAAAMVLIAGAGLLLNSFARLTHVDPGFDPRPLVMFRVGLPASRYPAWAHQQAFVSQLNTVLRSAPGVEETGIGTGLPFLPSMIGFGVSIPNGKQSGEANFRFVTAGFFRAFGVPIRRGREFTDEDRTGTTPVVVVNEAFSRRYFGGDDPVGRSLNFMESGPLQVVGVVGDTKLGRLDAEASAEISFPYFQPPSERVGYRGISGVLRANGDPLALIQTIRRAVKEIDPQLAVYDVTTMGQMLGDSYAESRLYTTTAAAVGAIALILAAVGLYGLVAYSVANRTREFGIRMALGADAARLIRSIIREGLALTAIGLAIGLAGALMMSRLLTRLLFDVEPRDPATLVGMSVLFACVAVFACYIPARRATRISPVIALRAE